MKNKLYELFIEDPNPINDELTKFGNCSEIQSGKFIIIDEKHLSRVSELEVWWCMLEEKINCYIAYPQSQKTEVKVEYDKKTGKYYENEYACNFIEEDELIFSKKVQKGEKNNE